MSADTPRRGPPRTEIALFLLLLLLGLLLTHYVRGPAPPVAREAVIRVSVGHDLLDGLTRGRQGLIGSLYWAPLPTLLTLPFIRLPAPLGGDWAPAFVAVTGAAFLCALLSAWLRYCRVPTLTRLAVALTVFLSPAVQNPAIQGSSAPVFGLLVVAATACLAHWWQTEQLRSLAYLALTLALAIVTRFQAVILIPIALLFVVAHLIIYRHRKSYAEATLIIFLVPSAYIAALWIATNWLIMGDPLFFLRGLTRLREANLTWTDLLAQGCNWERVFYLAAIVLLAWGMTAFTGRRRTPWTAVPVLAASLLLWTVPGIADDHVRLPADAEIAGIAAHIRTARPNDWIVVSGYRGYEIARALPHQGRDNFQHTLSFYPDQAVSKTRGRRVYLLVPEPKGPDRWEDVNLKYPRIFHRGAPFTVFEKTWACWRLWRIVRMDETDRR